MAALLSFQFTAIQTSVTFLFSLDFDSVCGRLHDLIRICILNSIAVYGAVPIKGTGTLMITMFYMKDLNKP